MQRQCLYTAQGEVVCTNNANDKKIEQFVAEQQNVSTNANTTGTAHAFVNNAIQQKYCDIQIQTDSSGKTSYTLKKECKK